MPSRPNNGNVYKVQIPIGCRTGSAVMSTAAFAEDLGLISSPVLGSSQLLETPAPGDGHLLLPSTGTNTKMSIHTPTCGFFNKGNTLRKIKVKVQISISFSKEFVIQN